MVSQKCSPKAIPKVFISIVGRNRFGKVRGVKSVKKPTTHHGGEKGQDAQIHHGQRPPAVS